MSWKLGTPVIRAPNLFNENPNVITPVVTSLNNTRKMDVFGTQKRTWELGYDVIEDTDYDVIKGEFDNQINTGNSRAFVVDERSINAIVIILMEPRSFRPGTTFLSDFTFRLVEV